VRAAAATHAAGRRDSFSTKGRAASGGPDATERGSLDASDTALRSRTVTILVVPALASPPGFLLGAVSHLNLRLAGLLDVRLFALDRLRDLLGFLYTAVRILGGDAGNR
jgi:hypothetical protein